MSPRRGLIVGAVAIVGLAGVIVLSRGGGGEQASTASAPSAVTDISAPRLVRLGATTPGPTSERDGMPAGFAQSEAGATAAAMAFASAPQRWMYLDDAGVERAVRAIATTSAAPRLAADVVAEVGAAREGLVAAAGPVWWLVRPLATNVEAVRADYARVAVWIVTVLSAADVAMPQSEWRTVTLELRWEADDWRVDSITDAPGPTPMAGPRDRTWAPEPFAESLQGFVRVGETAP